WTCARRMEAEPRSGKEPPTLYARLNDAGTAFEPGRNLITSAWGLNGGGAIAADAQGNVYVFWHAPMPGVSANEANRRVWMAKSSDDGKTFEKETVIYQPETGVCGCCGMHAFAGTDGAPRPVPLRLRNRASRYVPADFGRPRPHLPRRKRLEVEYRSLRHELRSLRAAERHHTRGVGNREAGLFRQDQWQHRAPVHRGAR